MHFVLFRFYFGVSCHILFGFEFFFRGIFHFACQLLPERHSWTFQTYGNALVVLVGGDLDYRFPADATFIVSGENPHGGRTRCDNASKSCGSTGLQATS